MKTNLLLMERVKLAGIEITTTIIKRAFDTDKKNVFFTYNGKTIPRPFVQKCVSVCKKEFNLNI